MAGLEGITSKEKAAILLISLGKDASAQIFKHLGDDEIEQLTLGITAIRRVDPEVRDAVLEEFFEICLAQKYISEGGIEYARDVLDKAIGEERANELIKRLSASLQVRPFEFVRRADPTQILNFIQNEYPQTIALILSYLDPKQAAQVLGELPQEKQAGVIARIATMGATSPEYIKEAEHVLERKIASMGLNEQAEVGGVDAIVAILNSIDRTTERYIMTTLEEKDAELAAEISSRMFVFEDIVKLTNPAVQRVIKEIDNSELALALKGTVPEVEKLLLDNVSKRVRETIKEDMQFMGPVRVRDVEEAQQKIVNVIRRLEDMGEIVVSRGGEDEVIV